MADKLSNTLSDHIDTMYTGTITNEVTGSCSLYNNFLKKKNGMCMLSTMMTVTTAIAAWTKILTLSEGFRPSVEVSFTSGTVNLYVQSNGGVYARNSIPTGERSIYVAFPV